MKQLRVRKIVTEASNLVMYLLFEEGDITKPMCILDEFQIEELLKEISLAKQDVNVLARYYKNDNSNEVIK